MAVLALAVAGTSCCHSPHLPTAPAAAASQLTVRHPPGVVVDPTPRLPEPGTQTSTGTVAILQAPTDPALAVEVVKRFFEAVITESASDLEAVFAPQARVSQGGSGHAPARNSWRARLARLDYSVLQGRPVYRVDAIEIYRKVGGLAPNRQAGPLPVAVDGDDILLRVPIVTPRVGSTRLFGDEMWFLLKPGPNGYRIAELIENFQLP